MENVTQGTLVAFWVLIKRAIVGAHLQIFDVDDALGFHSRDIFFLGLATAKIRNLGLRHALALLGDKHLKSRQVSLLLDLFLGLLLLQLNPALHSLDVSLKPPFRLKLSHFFLVHGLLSLGLKLCTINVLHATREPACILLVLVLGVDGIITSVRIV